jgi:hypothetical protein
MPILGMFIETLREFIDKWSQEKRPTVVYHKRALRAKQGLI